MGNFILAIMCHPVPGFPLIREIRENFEDFFQSGKPGENGVFSQNQGINFQIRELVFKTILIPFNPSKNVFRWFKFTLKPPYSIACGKL